MPNPPYDYADPVDHAVVPQKPWWESRAIIGSIVSSVAVGAAMAGVEFDQAQVTEIALGGIALASNALAWYGRVKATKLINTRQVLPGVTLQP